MRVLWPKYKLKLCVWKPVCDIYSRHEGNNRCIQHPRHCNVVSSHTSTQYLLVLKYHLVRKFFGSWSTSSTSVLTSKYRGKAANYGGFNAGRLSENVLTMKEIKFSRGGKVKQHKKELRESSQHEPLLITWRQACMDAHDLKASRWQPVHILQRFKPHSINPKGQSLGDGVR
jgi:hypothetical protein